MRNVPERLRKLHEAADRARAKRDGSCTHDAGYTTFVRVLRTGAEVNYEGCASCGQPRRSGLWVPKADAARDLPIDRDERTLNPPCVRCGQFGTELHHWAPAGIFGRDEAELWPTAYLCRGCHGYWHDMVTQVPQRKDTSV